MCSIGWKYFPVGVENLQPLQFVTFVSLCLRVFVFQEKIQAVQSVQKVSTLNPPWKIKMTRPDSMEKSRKINLMTLTVGNN
ncbi:MAG: hypothetical protein NT127_06235 [Sphingobacteriales bacterium]|nr:hypothetical protein [Sphingobacteriales bacterium]